MAQKETDQKYETEVILLLSFPLMKKFFISFEHVLMFLGKISLGITTALTMFLIGYMTHMLQLVSHLPALATQYFQLYVENWALPAWFDPLPVLRNFWTYSKDILAMWASLGFILFMIAAILLGVEHYKLGWKTVRTSTEQQKTLRRLVYALLLLILIRCSWFIAASLSDAITAIWLQAMVMI